MVFVHAEWHNLVEKLTRILVSRPFTFPRGTKANGAGSSRAVRQPLTNGGRD
jgi:hypothetical protein